ncbi:centromere protein J-like isoform X2 [Artibeus jamaicensis]|uniref:centromere protein J-like isoform X2 n=1 Tax=Artibeus jamaicensis TaxID=9417 RepID=UPI00235ABC1B|nr:centromere protein J-like isoform X2 [Artibeus jamaicensis]
MTPKRTGWKSHRAPLRGQGLCPESAPSSQPASIKIERIHSGEIVTREDGDKTVSISLRVRGAASARRGPPAEGKPAPLGGDKAATPPGRSSPTLSGRTPPGSAACSSPLTEDRPAAQDTAARPPSSEGPEGKPQPRAGTGGPAGPSADTEPQNLPVELESSQPVGTGPVGKEGKEEIRSPDSRVGEASSAGHEVITTPKDPKKDAGAKTTVLHFLNGDTQRILPDQRVVYYCAGARTTRTTHPSGLEVLRFPDKRTEKFYPDGSKETLFPDGTVKRLRDGREETVFPDGTSVSVERNGSRTIVFSNGQRDIHTAQFKRREYPDGTVKTVYSSGLQETKFTSGRVRVRQEASSIVLDQKQAVCHSQ